MTKRRLAMVDLTPNEQVAMNEALGAPMTEIIDSMRQPLMNAAVVWAFLRRDDPDVTFEAVCQLPIMRDYEIVMDDPPEASSGDNGMTPVSSLATGS